MTHPNLRFRYNDPTFCHSCGGDVHPVKDTHIGQICSECRKPCAYCEDWMMSDSGLMRGGKLMHIACALDVLEAERNANTITISPLQVVLLGDNLTTTNLF